MENLEIPSGILALILVLFIFFSAFFSAAETALTGSNKLRLKNIARTGDKRASIVMKLLDSFDRTLTTILIGNNVVNIAAASLAAAVSTAYMGASGLALATVLTTVIILIFGEIIPKDLAKDQPEKYAMKSARLLSEGNKAALAIFSTKGFSRLPVFKDDYSEIIGAVHARDFYASYLKDPDFDLKTILKPVVFVHTSTKIGLVIQNLQKAKVEMAIVVDSYGTIDGLVTTEDIVEELVGEIWDEHDRMTSSFRKIAQHTYLVNCDSNGQNANLFDLFRYLDLDNAVYGLENNSISGWVIERLGEIPEKGASFDEKNLHVTVTKTDAHRVKEIVVEVRPIKNEEHG